MDVLRNPINARRFWQLVAEKSGGQIHVTELRVLGVTWAEVDVIYRMQSAARVEPIRRTYTMSWPMIVNDFDAAADNLVTMAGKFGPGHIPSVE